MDELRRQAYQNLIDALLTCDNEEEKMGIMQANLELNAELLCNLGLAYRDNSQLPEAYNTFNAAIETVESMLSEIIVTG